MGRIKMVWIKKGSVLGKLIKSTAINLSSCLKICGIMAESSRNRHGSTGKMSSGLGYR